MMIVFCSYLAIFAKYTNMQVEVNAFIALIFFNPEAHHSSTTTKNQRNLLHDFEDLVGMLEDDCEPTQG